MQIKTHRIAAGAYEVTDSHRTVMVDRVDFGYGDEWIAIAGWDRRISTDPLPTKREAVHNAYAMLDEACGIRTHE